MVCSPCPVALWKAMERFNMAMVASSVPGVAVTAASGLGGVAVLAASVGVPAALDASCVPDEHAASKASPAPTHTYESCFFIDLLRCRWPLRVPKNDPCMSPSAGGLLQSPRDQNLTVARAQ
jgi:hypothetical protein